MFRSVHEFVHDLRNPDLPPSFLCHGQEPEGHRQSSGSRSCSLRYTRAQSYRRERRLDDVGASDRLPVRGRKVVEREQLLLVLGESGDSLRIPISVLLRERLDLFLRDRLRLGLEDICAAASWRAAAAATHTEPTLAALPATVFHGHELLASVLTNADQHQRTQPIRLEVDVGVNPVGEEVRIATIAQITLAPAFVLPLPLVDEASDRARREPRRGVFAQQRCQRLSEVARRQPAQVQHRQLLGDLRRPPHVRRQDRTREALGLAKLSGPAEETKTKSVYPVLEGHRASSQVVVS